MQINFVKWHGTGNDFVVVDDRDGSFPSGDLDLIRKLCDRHFGIGSDGLVLIQKGKGLSHDFHMEFFNPDGSQSFCGNGSRCAFAYWSELSKGREKQISQRSTVSTMDLGEEMKWRFHWDSRVACNWLSMGTMWISLIMVHHTNWSG
ncbi:MAG: hypothetical protein IPI91_09505 [Flavobacteriales bacterium]|nr:hypothetical protein [Flavobacteriales bacterium]